MGLEAEQGRGKERVLRAALDLFSARGFDRVTIRDIGAAAGLTNPALYRHYAGKEDLGVDLYRRCYRLLVDTVTAAVHGVEPVPERLAAYARAYVELAAERRAEILFIDEHKLRFWPAVSQEFGSRTVTGMVSSWLEEGRRDGTVRADVPTPTLVALVVGSLSHWVALNAAGLASSDDGRALAVVLASALTQGAS
jgi:AcrR family transcriptional regulator